MVIGTPTFTQLILQNMQQGCSSEQATHNRALTNNIPNKMQLSL